MKVLVTGAAGFIGMHVAQILLKRGDEVVGIDNLNDYYDPKLKLARLEQLKPYPNFKFVRGDIADRVVVEDLFAAEKFNRVINLAAQPGVRYSLKTPIPTSRPIWSASAICWKAAATTASSISSTPAVPASTAPTPTCRSRCTTTSTTRSVCMPPARRPTN
jgi:UDP-glucose 4-epimerase